MSRCSGNEIGALSEQVRAKNVDPNWTRASYMGRWNEKQEPANVASLIEALVDHGAGAGVAVSLSHRALESKQPLDVQLVVRALAASLPHVHGHELWVWQRVGFIVAKQTPAALFDALLGTVMTNGVGRADDEFEHVLTACCASVPALAPRLLELWETQPGLVARKLGATITAQVPADGLLQWAGEDRARQSAIGRMVPAYNAALTIQLVEALGESGPFASALEAAASSGTWSGNLSGFYASRGEEWQRFADEATTPRFRRFAQRIARRMNGAAEKSRREEADEEALER